MNQLKIRFSVRFEDHHIDFCPYGPKTHRWLPDGENDSILLNAGHSDYELKIWFKRRGKTESGAIRFSLNDFEVDPDAMARQGILDAGPMVSELLVKNIEQEKYDAVINNVKNDHYVKFAKEVIRIIIPPLNNFLRLIRFKHGQYWIREINDFDSQRGSLGSFCNMLQMKWSNDDGKNWNDFHPTPLEQRIVSYMGDKRSYMKDYLTKTDWDKLKSEVKSDFHSSLAKELCVQSWQYFDQGDVKHAIIEGITALEVCISEVMKTGLDRLNTTIDKIDDFKHGKLTTKLTVICSLNHSITKSELTDAVEIYDLRNKIVHDGEPAPEFFKIRPKLQSLLNVISKLTMNQTFKFPSANAGNAHMSAEEWNKLEDKS